MKPTKSFSLIPCENPLWAPDKHSQTILGDWIPSPQLKDPGKKWVLDLPDNDQVVCRVFEQDSPWVVTLFHGLTGSIDAGYMHRSTAEYLKQGHSVVRMNHRNCGEGRGLAKHPYHSGKSDDIGFVIAQVRKRFPGKKILAVGFSLSANAVLLLMSRVIPGSQIFDPDQFEDQKANLQIDLPDAAITVNAPINLERATHQLTKSLNRIYQYSFMSNLHVLIKELQQKGIIEPTEGIHSFMRTTDFDDRFTAPRSGFDSGLHYYQTCSAQKHVQKIDRPTGCLMSLNDPFIAYEDYMATHFSKSTLLHFEENGGHMGYLHKEKTPLGSFRWLDYGVMEISNELFRIS